MKRCAKCKREYADEFDACPECAKDARLVEVASGFRNLGCLLIALVSVPVLLVMCSR